MGEVVAELQLGMKVREKITGVIGTVTCIARYLYERPQAMIEYTDKNGMACEKWAAVDRLEVIE